jgi:hypothetical protein
VKLPQADERLIERLLSALANYFDSNDVKIDRAVHNPARIVRLYGTLAAKGDNTEERPHRLSKIITTRSLVALTKEESLQNVLADLGAPATPKVSKSQGFADRNRKPDKAEIREMLRFIPKRPAYPDWIKVVAAVGDAMGDTLSEADAIELLKEWSPEEQEGEYADKLRHPLKHIHIGTLIYLAKQQGWTPKISEDDQRDLTSLTSLGAADYPAPLEQAAFHGLAGEFVKRGEPHTEADPVALLIQFIITYGNVIGRNAHAIADASWHGGNLNAVFTGETAKSRKGTSWKHVLRLFDHVDSEWRKNCIATGLSSGEGLIWAVRDPITKTVKNKESESYETEIVDPGVSDKRLIVIEEEFSRPLVVAAREGNILSAVLRSAWDGDEILRTMTKNSPARATGAHISIIGHITRHEFRILLTETAYANGFGNRFLPIAVRRSKVLPEGGRSYGIADLVEGLQNAVAFAKSAGELKRDEAARKLWAGVYPKLSAGTPGLLGAITARAEAQVLRLSVLYALLDCSQEVRVEHLKAALAVWKYCEDSARWIFETRTGDKNADRILAALKVAGEKGLTKWQITNDVFNRHATKFEIDEALRTLHAQGLADVRTDENTGGRPSERWFYRAAPREESEESPVEESNAPFSSHTSHLQPIQNTSSGDSDVEDASDDVDPFLPVEIGDVLI